MNVEESDCCGNGCANCILDINKTSKDVVRKLENNINCLHTKNLYELISVEYVVEPDILKMRFKLNTQVISDNQSNDLVLYIPPGHHIMMQTSLYSRPYTPFWVDEKNLQFEILINLRPNGAMSKYIKQLRLGDLVLFKGPIGKFHHEINKYEYLLLFTNGVAVASVIPIIEQILNNEDDMTRIIFFGCFTDLENFYFRENFFNYKQYWNFIGTSYLAKENCGYDCKTQDEIKNESCNKKECCIHLKQKLKYGEKILNRRLTTEDISECIDSINTNKVKVVVCGSKSFENFIKESLDICKINKENIDVL
ncbi:NADH-cytochrome b5 reductase-like [Condylostylus longicornis]|uniref:NADH-cytochrome b5 reductase-like n=1 Tax=Condylostylus longicornis TaxID=2530218 RepID=UPI00244DFC72|nr:NADH-cytochrome b5 reductase-like [Condylostylus longicornis]